MIVSGYTLHLYCDNPACLQRNRHDFGQDMGEYLGETFAECARQARRAEWILFRKTGKALCPVCTKSGIKKI